MATTAKDEGKKFEELRQLLSGYPSQFCLVYRRMPSVIGLKLRWCKAAAMNEKAHEEFEALAAKYKQAAAFCFRHKHNLVLEELQRKQNSKIRRWQGLSIPTNKEETPMPANSLGKRWWHLFVGTGAIRDAGYVIVARIAAKESSEVHDCIARTQQIWTDDDESPTAPHKR